MKKIRLKKLNNQGSTFVMAIIVITLVTMLAVAILAASTHNMAMKAVDRNSKETFYNAETVMDEVRAGIGIESMKQLGLAYEKVITSLVSQDPDEIGYVVNNEAANERFKAYFIESMYYLITGESFGTGDFVTSLDEDGAIKNYLKQFLVGYDNDKMAEILSVGSIEAYKEGTGRSYMIIIRDVALRYREEKHGEIYFTNVTTDLEIQFPNMTVAFTSTNRLKDYIKYVFIADDNIDVGAETLSNGVVVSSTASIYAGNKINILSNENGASKLYMNSLSDNINVICGGNESIDDMVSGTIVVGGSIKYPAEFITTKTNVWCTNIKIKNNPLVINDKEIGDTTAGATVSLGGNTYVKDDLTIDGQDSNVSISGTYYGYSQDGKDEYLHANSSAIIVNGKRAKLNISASKLLLAGHSYIEIPDSSNNNIYQMTGEALSFRGNQDLYLIPAEYLGINYGKPVSNPMSPSEWTALENASKADDSTVKICEMKGFFTNYIDTDSGKIQYIKQQKGNDTTGLVYLYINFKNKDAAADYIFDIAMNKNNPPQYLRNMLRNYTENLFDEGAESDTDKGFVNVVDPNPNDEIPNIIHSNGTVLNTGSASSSSDASILGDKYTGANSEEPLGDDQFAITSMDLSKRYKILTHLLVDIPWTTANGGKYIVNSEESALWQAKEYFVSGTELDGSNIFYTIIDKAILDAETGYNTDGETFNITDENGKTKKYIKIIKKGDYTINCDEGEKLYGVVVATGTVTVKGNFSGMIIAGKDIEIEKNVEVSNDPELVEKLIAETSLYENYTDTNKPKVAFSEFFHAFKHAATDDESREEVKIEKVNYKDIVKLNNWRKYYDEKESSTSE